MRKSSKSKTTAPRVVTLRGACTHIAIEMPHDGDQVSFIPLMIHTIERDELPALIFNTMYAPMKDYPVERAAKLFAGIATRIGGTPEAMAALGSIVDVTSAEVDLAAAQLKARADALKPWRRHWRRQKPKKKTKAKKKSKPKAATKKASAVNSR